MTMTVLRPDQRSGPPAAAGPPARRRLSLGARIKRDRMLLLFAAPGMLLLIVFHYLPLLGNVIAFQDYLPFLGFRGSEWAGLSNFSVLVIGDAEFLTALQNTLVLSLIQTVFVFPIPILLALALNSLLSERVKKLVQSILYLPHFLSWVIVVSLFQQILGGSGIVNQFLRQQGFGVLNVIGNPDAFFAVLTSQVVWKDSGWATILFLAALSRIDVEQYEAAAVDGASRWRQLWHVTLPGLRGIIVLLLILKLGDSLTVGFEQIILQQPAVGQQASEVLDTYVYNNGIVNGDWGTAAAVGLVKGLVGAALVFGANKIAHLFGEAGVYQR